ncbi:GNAT family N-acetyltransferase [Candidatus Woesearchaeota archaeon]|nr:GNAT family N-acetyltransferase [Candidatus Woesearchaeota archaeon]
MQVSLLTPTSPVLSSLLEKVKTAKHWKTLFFLDTLTAFNHVFSAHAQPYVLTFEQGFLLVMEKKGPYFQALSDFLLGDGFLGDEPAHLDGALGNTHYSFCLAGQQQLPNHTNILSTEYFFVKPSMQDFSSYLQGLGPGWRKELRRRKNKWVQLSCVPVTHVSARMGDFFVMHRARFGPSFYNSKELMTYVYLLLKTRPHDIFAFELQRDGASLGAIIWVRMGQRLNLFSMVYDPSAEVLSPGKALVYFSLQYLFQLPEEYEINFDTGYGHYKEHWAKQTRTYTVYLPTNGLPVQVPCAGQRTGDTSHFAPEKISL